MTSAVWDDLRAAWGAVASTNPVTVSPTLRTGFMTHWNGPKVGILPTDAHTRCLAYVKAVQTFHMGPDRGWADVGYNGFVCVHGRAIEGRGVGMQGAHCPNYNVNTIGVVLITGQGDATVPPAALARQRRLYDQCVAYAGRTLRMLGHRDGVATDCPGTTLYAWVKAGMPAPQEEMFTVGQFEDIMAAVAAVKADVATLTNKVDQKANGVDVKDTKAAVTALSSTVTAAHADEMTRLGELTGRLDGIGDAVAQQVTAATVEAINDSLGGVEITSTARFVAR